MGTRSVRVTVLCLMSVCVLVLSGTGLASAAPGSGDVAGPVDVGGRRVWLECHGAARPGVPTVVLMSGYGSAGDIWDVVDPALTPPPEPVAPALARELRVCSYDRPQTLRADDAITTRSDPVAQPRTARDWASELGALLTAARVPGPFVLVAHSLSRSRAWSWSTPPARSCAIYSPLPSRRSSAHLPRSRGLNNLIGGPVSRRSSPPRGHIRIPRHCPPGCSPPV
jgi:hypothetical protein